MKVLDKWIQGNQAEHYVQFLLSKHCFLRPIAGNTDVGIDLYCESVVDSKPFLHFFVQIKSSKDISNEKVQQSFQFKVEHLKYWKRQPVPVLVFLVPNPQQVTDIMYIHVVDITKQLMSIDIDESHDTQTLKSEMELAIDLSDDCRRDKCLDSLMVSHIPWLYSALYLRHGCATPAPKVTDSDPKNYYATQFIGKYRNEFLSSLKAYVTFYLSSSGNDKAERDLFDQFSQSIDKLIAGLGR